MRRGRGDWLVLIENFYKYIKECKNMKKIDSLIQSMLQSYARNADLTNMQAAPLPSKSCVTDLTHRLESLLYPGLTDCVRNSDGMIYAVGNRMSEAYQDMVRLIAISLRYAQTCENCRMRLESTELPVEEQAEGLAYAFFEKLPTMRDVLRTDLHAAYMGDPAAKYYAEIILSYPGFRALAIHRMAHILFQAGVPILPRMMSEFAHNRTGIDIHPGARIGQGFFIDHGTGVVIGETSVIGNNVKLYQGVTLGALSIPNPDSSMGVKRHPTLEDDVTIYSGASILGGETVVGARSVIGANVWLTHSVAPDTKVLYVPPELRFKSMGTPSPAKN